MQPNGYAFVRLAGLTLALCNPQGPRTATVSVGLPGPCGVEAPYHALGKGPWGKLYGTEMARQLVRLSNYYL